MITLIKKSTTSSLIRNEILQDTRLTFGAIGLLCVTSPLSDVEYTIDELAALSSSSIDEVQTILNELAAFGYLTESTEEPEEGA